MEILIGGLIILLCLLLAALVFTAGVLGLSVLLSFTVAWYERLGHEPAAAERQPAKAAFLMAREFASLLLTLLLRPLGWLPAFPLWRRPRRTPVILLHGLFQNRSCLLLLHWHLSAAGYDQVLSINTPPWLDLDTLVDRVARAVEQACRETGAARVHLVGHSMGGILARCYIQLHGGAERVAGCVTIGTPHAGSKLAPFAVSRLGRELLPGSPLLTRLHAAPLPGGVRFTSIYSQHDNIVLPADSARLDGADNIELAGIGHTSLLFSPAVAQDVVKALTHPSLLTEPS